MSWAKLTNCANETPSSSFSVKTPSSRAFCALTFKSLLLAIAHLPGHCCPKRGPPGVSFSHSAENDTWQAGDIRALALTYPDERLRLCRSSCAKLPAAAIAMPHMQPLGGRSRLAYPLCRDRFLPEKHQA